MFSTWIQMSDLRNTVADGRITKTGRTKQCDICGGTFGAQGLSKHRKKCEGDRALAEKQAVYEAERILGRRDGDPGE